MQLIQLKQLYHLRSHQNLCKGKKKKIGEIHSSSISESTLHCALKLGGGCGLINASKSDSYSLLEYLKQNQNKQINKQGENNVTK